MKWFQVLVRGENFLLEGPDGIEVHGFYTTRYLEADSEDQAETVAVDMIRGDSYLKENTRNDRNDPPMIFVEEVEEVDRSEVPKVLPGFIFFVGDDVVDG